MVRPAEGGTPAWPGVLRNRKADATHVRYGWEAAFGEVRARAVALRTPSARVFASAEDQS